METTARQVEGLSTLLQLESEARRAADVRELAFVLVNETHRLVPYRQALVWRVDRPGKARLTTVSGVAAVDRTTPYGVWAEKLGAAISRSVGAEPRPLIAGDVPESLRAGLAEWLPPRLLAVPIIGLDGRWLGLLLLSRDGAEWSDGDQLLLGRLAEAYAHAWRALEPKGPPISIRLRGTLGSKFFISAVAAGVVAAMFVPITQSALAPAEVTAVEPAVVSAPMDGVVAAIHVEPNQTVTAGTPLLELDDTMLRNRRDVAKRALAVAEAQLQRAAKRAFRDAESKAQVSVLEAKVAEKVAELSFTEELLTRIRLHAAQDGIAVFRDPNEWIGRPVRTGERIMVIADPAKTELSMDLPVDDAIDVDEGARVQLFLNVDPLNPREAFLVSASYQAGLSERNVLAFRLRARFPIGEARPRLGLKGTAKIYADEVPLWLFLFGKPISVVRRMLGL